MTAGRLAGIDTSHYQRVTDWPLVARSWDFAIFKAIEGRRVDSDFDFCATAAREEAMTWGAYAFFRPDVPVVDQINAYFAVLDGVRYGEANLYPAIDVEQEAGLPFGPSTHATQVTAFARAIIERYGKCIIYTSQHYWSLIGNPAVMLDPDVVLWTSHYTDAPEPACPMRKAWRLWQHGVKPAPGIVSADGVDQNVCEGELPIIEAPDTIPAPPGFDTRAILT